MKRGIHGYPPSRFSNIVVSTYDKTHKHGYPKCRVFVRRTSKKFPAYQKHGNDWVKIQELEIIDETAAKGKLKSHAKRSHGKSRLFMFGDRITHKQHKLDGTTSEVIDVAWQYRESSWMIPFLKGPNRFIGILLRRS